MLFEEIAHTLDVSEVTLDGKTWMLSDSESKHELESWTLSKR